MSRSTLFVLAIVSLLICASYAQEPAAKPQASTPPTPAAGSQSPAPSPGTPAPAPESSATKPAPNPKAVPLSEAVITLKGACKPKAGTTARPAGCITSLTRAQFEKLTKALTPPGRPPMPPDVVREFAGKYAKLLIFSDMARQMGLENDPQVQQILGFTRNQILAEMLNQRITEEYAHPAEQQIETYYNENPKKFREATLQRIIVQRNLNVPGKPKPTEAEEEAYAEKIKERWVGGEDPEKLQKEAAEHVGAPNGGPTVDVGPRRSGTLPEAHEAVFDLKAGEFSPVYSDPSSFYIYKVVSARQVPLSDVKSTITSTLQRQAIIARIQQIQSSVTPVLNDAYFGPEKPPMVQQHILRPPARNMPPPNPGNPPTPGAGTPAPKPGNAPPQTPPAPPQ
jgi:PPIC-type PPIASE domain